MDFVRGRGGGGGLLWGGGGLWWRMGVRGGDGDEGGG